MGKLKKRYDQDEIETLLACIKPYERWTTSERKAWVASDCFGFRHFTAPNITPIRTLSAEAFDDRCLYKMGQSFSGRIAPTLSAYTHDLGRHGAGLIDLPLRHGRDLG